jgi:hypothetical protein
MPLCCRSSKRQKSAHRSVRPGSIADVLMAPAALSPGLAQTPIGAESPLSQTDLIQAAADAGVALHAHDYTVDRADRVGNGNLSPVREA